VKNGITVPRSSYVPGFRRNYLEEREALDTQDT
jgi:hypothetical protein